ncbi:MAG: 3'-5' exonuclease [Anaerolineales bacterium]|nr:3'-5' exonuclease [Anaerolineales bacterium]
MQASGGRKAAIEFARAKLVLRPVYIDTETTGLGRDAEIIEICVLDHDGLVLIDTLVKPTQPIPWYVTAKVHGISSQMVAKSPTWREIWPDVAATLAGRQVAVFNAAFDERMMQQSHAAHRLRWQLAGAEFFCVMQTYAQFCGRLTNLAAASQNCRLSVQTAHRARVDAELARGVLQFVGNCRR